MTFRFATLANRPPASGLNAGERGVSVDVWAVTGRKRRGHAEGRFGIRNVRHGTLERKENVCDESAQSDTEGKEKGFKFEMPRCYIEIIGGIDF